MIAAVGLGLLPAAWRRPEQPGRAKEGGAGLIALGMSLALVNLAYYLAIDHLAVAVAIVLQYSGPAMVVAWVALRTRRRPAREIAVALGATLGGVVLVSEVFAGDLKGLDLFGVAMGLASAVLFATYTLLSERS